MLLHFIIVPYLVEMAFSVWQIHFLQSMFCINYIMEIFPLIFAILLVTLIFFDFVQIYVQLIWPPYCSSYLIWHFGFIFCLKIPWIIFIFNLSGDIVVFDSFKNCSLSLILNVTLRSGTISVSLFNTFRDCFFLS
jgi:hypothetical protein